MATLSLESSATAQKQESRLDPKGARYSCSCHFWVYLSSFLECR